MMDWGKLKLFYYVANYGSISKASEYLNVSPSSLGRSIQSLEYRIKTPLFKRHTRGLTLTRQGEELYKTASRIYCDIAQAETLLQEDKKIPQGLLRVSTSAALAGTWLVHYLAGFLEKYPKMALAIKGEDREIDLNLSDSDVLISTYIPDRPDLIQKKLMTFHVKLYASSKYLEKFGVPEKVEDLDRHRLIIYGTNISAPYKDINWVLRVGIPFGRIREPYLQINSPMGMFHAAEAGLGIIAFSEEYKYFPTFKGATLVPVLPEVKGPELTRYYIYPEQLKESKRVKAFGEYLENILHSSEH